jgi:hypothetical protein
MMAVMDKAQRASGYALDLQTIVGEELVSLSAKVQNLDFRDLFGQLTEIDGELAKGTLNAEERQAAMEAREELAGVFANGIRDTRTKLRDAAKRIQDKAAEVSGVVLAERTRDLLAQHQQQQPQLKQQIDKKREKWDELDKDRAKIIAAQDVIRSRNIADIMKDFIPKDLEKIDLKKPEAEAIRLGVEVLKKILGEVSEGFKYSDLANQRKVLDDQIGELDREIRQLVDEQDVNDRLVGDLSAVIAIDQKRSELMTEINKLAAAFSGFDDEVGSLSGTAVNEKAISRLLDSMRSYFGNCLNARNKTIVT